MKDAWVANGALGDWAPPSVVASGNLALDVSACSSYQTTIDDDSAVGGAGAKVESIDRDSEACELDYNLKLPFKLRKLWAMKQKIDDGTWLPDSEWRRQTVKMSANERKKLRKQRESAPRGTAGADSNQGWEERALGRFCGGKRRFSEEEAVELRGRILDEVLSAEVVFLQFKMCFSEMGALGMLCGNEETRDWLRGLDLGLGISDPGGIGVFHRVGPMAEKDSATILIAIGKQNAGISVSDWKVVGVIHTGASRTMAILVDEQSSPTLKGRN
ncbi:hypothetical protein J6590_081314 [Homalodisca vitripennis]|nr:hypothetical protein J6590_081314 [Homalodisca vitripennis]